MTDEVRARAMAITRSSWVVGHGRILDTVALGEARVSTR
jgi:hypothetical protein